MRAFLFALGVLLLVVPEFFRVYCIMPFPGSQEDLPSDLRQVDLAYWLHRNIGWIRLGGASLLAMPFLHLWKNSGWGRRILLSLPVAFSALIILAFNFKFMADKMFLPPKVKAMAPPYITDSTANALVIAVEQNGDARAYPIETIGYHHQVLDTVGGRPVLVTYCTVCRTGRAWKPEVNGHPETFRLVGMDHFNAMFEDRTTGSWWRQVSGECIEGPLKGQQLEEVPSRQMTLQEFATLHPMGLVLRPDSAFATQYAALQGYDDGTIESDLENRDSSSWEPKSWVVGVVHKGASRAYDWNDLVMNRITRDTLSGDSIVIEVNGASFRVTMAANPPDGGVDNGSPVALDEGSMTSDHTEVAMERRPIAAYQEFWHSWRTFHPNTTRYFPKQ